MTHEEIAIYRIAVHTRGGSDPRSDGLLSAARSLGMQNISSMECSDLYFLEVRVAGGEGPHPEALQLLADNLLSDPITQSAQRGRIFLPATLSQVGGEGIIEVALRPGVTDPVAEHIVRACAEMGFGWVARAATGQRYLVQGEGITSADLHRLARRLLANPVIQRYALGEIAPSFPQAAEASGETEILPLRECDDSGLMRVSQERRAALDLAEMRAIQAYFRSEGREPTDVEFETIAQTWSEHCIHKTFKARIDLDGETIDGLLRATIRRATEEIAAPWVRSAFVDNAGIVDFDDQYEVSFKVETHNHPSAIEPFGGANTGVGGVIRDVLGVSAKPIAATDVLCFGPQDTPLEALPEGVLHPRRVFSGVVAGVQDYGNKIGIPTVNGAILYDEGYTANPLVFCGCVGIAPKGFHPRNPLPGDRVILLGGRTGRDGLRGATFSSMTMDGQTGEVAGASVQIGDPITEKGLVEVITRARDQRLYHAVTDCGAGGLSSAVGEMAGDTGAEVALERVPLKYPGLAPWEIWLSEAQERMVLAVPAENLGALGKLCSLFEVTLTDIGAFTASGRLEVRYAGRKVLDLENRFLHSGIPQRRLTARRWQEEDQPVTGATLGDDPNAALLALLSQPDNASKAGVIRLYDHEVQGGTVVKPLTGAKDDGPSDACVLKPQGTAGTHGIVLSNGINPQLGKRDPYRMAVSAVDEAIRNAVAVGADPERIALLDNFCWGDPQRPETLGALVAAAQGCHDAALHYRSPFISGKDSLNNEYLGADGQRHAIPPTLLISAIGIIEDIGKAMTMDLKAPGDRLYLLDGNAEPLSLGGAPGMPVHAPDLYRRLHAAMRQGLVRACHDLSQGGLAAAAAEMCIGARLGMQIHLEEAETRVALFGEANGRLLVEVRPQESPAFEALFAPGMVALIGEVLAEQRLLISDRQGNRLVSLAVEDLVAAWQVEP